MSLIEGPPDDLPYPKLPFWDVVSLSYSTYFRHFIDVLRASWLWLVVVAVFTGFASWHQWSWMAVAMANLKPGWPPQMSKPRRNGASESRQYPDTACRREHRGGVAPAHDPERTARPLRQQRRDQEPVALHRYSDCYLPDRFPAGSSGYVSCVLFRVSLESRWEPTAFRILRSDPAHPCALRSRYCRRVSFEFVATRTGGRRLELDVQTDVASYPRQHLAAVLGHRRDHDAAIVARADRLPDNDRSP